MNYFDIAITVIVFIFIVMGFRKGLVAEVVGLIGILIAFYLAYRFSADAATLIPQQFNLPPTLNIMLGFLIVFGGIMLFFKMLAKTLEKTIQPTVLNWLDKTGGIAIGGAKGVIAASIVIFLFSLTPIAPKVEADTNKSLFYNRIIYVAPMLFETVYDMFPIGKPLNDIKNGFISKVDVSTSGAGAADTVEKLRPERRPQESNRSTSYNF